MSTEIKIKVKSCPLVPIDKLEIIQGNLKELSKAGYEKLKGRIARLGFDAPIFVWKGKVLDGTQRIRTVQKMIEDGFSLPGNKLPIVEILAKDLNEAKERLLGYISQFGKVTDEGLYEFVQGLDINFDTLDLPDFNMDKFKIGWFEKEVALTDEDAVPELPKKAKSKRGQIYQLGRHRVMCGDSTCREDVDKLMGGRKADMVFTDPPYGVSIGDKNKLLDTVEKADRIKDNIYQDTLCPEELKESLVKSFINIKSISNDLCSYFITAPQGGELGMMMMMMKEAGLPIRHIIIWVKNRQCFSFGRLDYEYKHEPILYTWNKKHRFYGKGQYKSSVWEIDKEQKCDLHPTMKPVELIVNALMNNSTDNNIVCDFFLGSGSTLIACEKTNRICFGLEIEPLYVDVIIKRWEDYVGKGAVKI